MTDLCENGLTKKQEVFQFPQPMLRLSRTLRLSEYSREGLPQTPQHTHMNNSMYTHPQGHSSVPGHQVPDTGPPQRGRQTFLTILSDTPTLS